MNGGERNVLPTNKTSHSFRAIGSTRRGKKRENEGSKRREIIKEGESKIKRSFNINELQRTLSFHVIVITCTPNRFTRCSFFLLLEPGTSPPSRPSSTWRSILFFIIYPFLIRHRYRGKDSQAFTYQPTENACALLLLIKLNEHSV